MAKTITKQDAASLPVVARGRRGVKPKYDWDAVREAYVEGEEIADGSIVYKNNRELAESFNVPYDQLRHKSSVERWPERRNQYQLKIAQERQKKRITELATKAHDFDASAFNVAKLGLAMVTTRLAEIAQEQKASQPRIAEAKQRLERGEPVEKAELYSAIYHRELEGLAGAAEKFQAIGMRALGTDVRKMEVTSPDGSLVGATQINIHTEMTRDDPNRLVELLKAVEDSGLIERMLIGAGQDTDDIIDVEEVET